MSPVKILVAEDDAISRRILEASLRRWGYQLAVAEDGLRALQIMTQQDHPPLAILDWMMPGMDGLAVCREVRQSRPTQPSYLIILTSRNSKADIVEGLEAGADDYISKPFNQEELRVRIMAGARIVDLQQKLAERVNELTQALQQVKQLQGLLPICSYCKKIRNDQNYWQRVESYIGERSEAQFSHGICPDCFESIVKPQLSVSAPHREGA